MKKVLNAVVDILIVIVLLCSVLVLSLSLTSKKNGVPSLLGYTIFTVQTDSMEPTINAGDLMVSKLTDQNDEFAVGDVVTFVAYQDNVQYLNTHRIIEVNETNGLKYYTTKGDNALGEDNTAMTAGDIVAIWNGFRVPGAGKVVDYLQTQSGFFVCILLPMIIFFLYTLYCFIANLIKYDREKAIDAAKAATAELTEEQKQKAIEEYLAKKEEESKNE